MPINTVIMVVILELLAGIVAGRAVAIWFKRNSEGAWVARTELLPGARGKRPNLYLVPALAGRSSRMAGSDAAYPRRMLKLVWPGAPSAGGMKAQFGSVLLDRAERTDEKTKPRVMMG